MVENLHMEKLLVHILLIVLANNAWKKGAIQFLLQNYALVYLFTHLLLWLYAKK